MPSRKARAQGHVSPRRNKPIPPSKKRPVETLRVVAMRWTMEDKKLAKTAANIFKDLLAERAPQLQGTAKAEPPGVVVTVTVLSTGDTHARQRAVQKMKDITKRSAISWGGVGLPEMEVSPFV